MIPKIIHYCWYGNKKKPSSINKYMQTWKKLGDDYNIIEWNEANCDLKCNDYVRSAVENSNWAFVSDYFRIVALYKMGGIYLDTDVEIFNKFDELLKFSGFLGYMNDALIGTAVLGFEKNSKFMKDILELYNNAVWVKGTKDKF